MNLYYKPNSYWNSIILAKITWDCSRDVTICYRDFPINRTAEANVDSTTGWANPQVGEAKRDLSNYLSEACRLFWGSGSEKPKKTC